VLKAHAVIERVRATANTARREVVMTRVILCWFATAVASSMPAKSIANSLVSVAKCEFVARWVA